MFVKFGIRISNPITNELVMDKEVYLLDSKKVKKAQETRYKLHEVLSRKHPQCIVTIKLDGLWIVSKLPLQMYEDIDKLSKKIISYKEYSDKWFKKENNFG
jgi:hypothetical protein